MKIKIKLTVIAMLFISVGLKAQWNPKGDNTTTGTLRVGRFVMYSGDGKTCFGIRSPSSSEDPFTISLSDATIKGGIMIGREDWMSKVIIPWKVGIGTTSPNTILHIRDKGAGVSANTSTVKQGLTIGTENTRGVLNMGVNSGGAFYSWIQSRYINAANYLNLALNPAGGKVGIGTTNFVGNHKLYVAGSILTEEIQVKLKANWPDYVFASDYNLRSLNEVETYIEQNNHLPDIPSQKEVNEKGINLGNMDAKLLQKIEELTLYIIQQNKKIENMQKQIDELKK